MSAYAVNVLLAIVRITLWFGILFVLLPRRLFSATPSGPWTRCMFDHVVRMAFASLLIVHLLVFLHLYDIFSLIGSYIAIYLGYLAWVLKVSPRAAARHLWATLVVFSLDLLEMRIRLQRWLAECLRRIWHSLVSALPHGTDLLWAGAFSTVLGASAYLRLQDAVRHPAPALSDYYLHLLWLKAIGVNRLYVDGVYPYGTHALLQVLHQFTVLDEALLLRVTPGLVGTLLVITIYWTVVRLTNHRGPALTAAALYGIFAFAGWLPLSRPLHGDVLAVEVALIFLLPTFVFLTEALAGGPEKSAPASLLFFQGLTCLFLIHPFVGVLSLVGLVGALLATAALDRSSGTGARRAMPLLRLAGMGLAATLLGILPLLLALAWRGIHPGPLRWDVHFLGSRLREGRFLPPAPPPPEPTLLLTLTTAGAFLLVLLPSRWEQAGHVVQTARQVFGTFMLLLVMLVQPASFHLPELVLPAQVARVLALVLCAVAGLSLHQGWAFLQGAAHRAVAALPHGWQHLGRMASLNAESLELSLTATALVTLLIATPPLVVPLPPRREYDVATEQLYRIKRELTPYRWTVISYPEALPQIFGRGYFVDNEVFLQRYRPETWRFDPRKPELAVPSPHVFIFVEKRPLVVPGTTVEEADRRDRVRRQLLAWVERYRALHNDMSLYYEDDTLAVYHIYRPPEVEEGILEEIERQERERRRKDE